MGLLDLLPMVCNTQIRTRTIDAMGGSKDSYANVSTDVECWRQPASDSQLTEYQKRGIVVTDQMFFTADPNVDERHILNDVRNRGAMAGTGATLEVKSRSLPDASAGLGVVWSVMAETSTTGATPS